MRANSKLDMLRIQSELRDLNKWRQQAVVSDRAALVYYGSLLTVYYHRLQEFALKLSVSTPSVHTALFNASAVPPTEADAVVIRKRLQQVVVIPPIL